MKKFLALMAISMLICGTAMADNRLRPNISFQELTDLAGSSVADGDGVLMYDASSGDWVVTSMEGWAELGDSLDGLTATDTEINRTSDLSARVVTLDADDTLTVAAHSDRILLTSASSESTAHTLWDAEATGGKACIQISAAATAAFAVTVQVAATNENILAGKLVGRNSADTISYYSAAAATSDTITFDSSNSAKGDVICFADNVAGQFDISGWSSLTSGNAAEANQDAVAFSSAVAD